MKKFFLPVYCYFRLTAYDLERLFKLALWFAKKSITPIVLTWIFWVAFQVVNGFSR